MFLVGFGIFILPISKYSYILQALKKMYWARTHDDEFFMREDPKLTLTKKKVSESEVEGIKGL